MRLQKGRKLLRYFISNEKATHFDEQIDAVLEEMTRVGVTSDQYPNLLQYLERLNKAKVEERRNPVSPDTVAQIFGNLAGILLIVAYEQKHVMTSKGFSQLIRPRTQ